MLVSSRIPKKQLEVAAKFLSRLLKYEFIYKPIPDFAENFEEVRQVVVHHLDPPVQTLDTTLM